MAVLDLQEQEQVEALKAWWKDNGKGIVLVAALALSGFGAMQGWHAYQNKQASAASSLYGELVKQVSSQDAKRINDAAAAVSDQYGGTVYAVRAQLLAAQSNLDKGDAAQAKKQLQWVAEHASEESLASLARLKLASVWLDEKNFAEAQKQLEGKHPESFDGLFADLIGDILNAQGKTAEARTAYQSAWNKTDAKSQYRSLIELKLSAVGGEVAAEKVAEKTKDGVEK
jgi:predicted negative regulator of RcsB-dependent stress response